jgi:hypothetical protein
LRAGAFRFVARIPWNYFSTFTTRFLSFTYEQFPFSEWQWVGEWTFPRENVRRLPKSCLAIGHRLHCGPGLQQIVELKHERETARADHACHGLKSGAKQSSRCSRLKCLAISAPQVLTLLKLVEADNPPLHAKVTSQLRARATTAGVVGKTVAGAPSVCDLRTQYWRGFSSSSTWCMARCRA